MVKSRDEELKRKDAELHRREGIAQRIAEDCGNTVSLTQAQLQAERAAIQQQLQTQLQTERQTMQREIQAEREAMQTLLADKQNDVQRQVQEAVGKYAKQTARRTQNPRESGSASSTGLQASEPRPASGQATAAPMEIDPECRRQKTDAIERDRMLSLELQMQEQQRSLAGQTQTSTGPAASTANIDLRTVVSEQLSPLVNVIAQLGRRMDSLERPAEVGKAEQRNQSSKDTIAVQRVETVRPGRGRGNSCTASARPNTKCFASTPVMGRPGLQRLR